MKRYVVKVTQTFHGENKFRKNGETVVHYIGKGGYVREKLEWVEPWTHRRFAEHYIKTDSEWNKKYEPDWESVYEVVEWES